MKFLKTLSTILFLIATFTPKKLTSDQQISTSGKPVITKPTFSKPVIMKPIFSKPTISNPHQMHTKTIQPATIKTSTIPAQITTRPVEVTSPTGLPSKSATSSTATTITPAGTTLSSVATGDSFVFTNGTLTEYLDPTGIYFYAGTINNSTTTDYMVAMPDYLFHLLLQNVNNPYPAYNPSTGILEAPGQKLGTMAINYEEKSKAQQHIKHAVSLITGNCYQFDPKFTPSATGTSSHIFTNAGALKSLSDQTAINPKGPIPGMYGIYAPYPNFQGRLSKTLATSIEAAINAFNTAAKTKSLQAPSYSLTNRFIATKSATIYRLENITLTEMLDESGVYVYEGTWTQSPPTNASFTGSDYFIFTTPYFFSELNVATTNYPQYNYQTPTQPLLFPGQQLNQTYAAPNQATSKITATTTPSSTAPTSPQTSLQVVTTAISLVTGTCYQLMQNRTTLYSGFPALASTTINTNVSLQPLPKTSQLSSSPYALYAPYQNFSGKLSSAMITTLTAAISAMNAAKTVITPASITTPTIISSSSSTTSTPSSSNATSGSNNFGTSLLNNPSATTTSISSLSDYDDEDSSSDDDNSSDDDDNFSDGDDDSNEGGFDFDSGEDSSGGGFNSNDNDAFGSDDTSSSLSSSDTSYSPDSSSNTFGSSSSFSSDNSSPSYSQSTASYGSTMATTTPLQPTSLLTESTIKDAELESENNTQNKSISITSGQGSPLPFN